MEAIRQRTRLDGAIELATAALHGGVAAVEGVHGAIARKPFAALRVAPGVAEVAEIVRVVHDGITSLVYGGVRVGVTLAGEALRAAAAVAPIEDRDPRPDSPAGLTLAALNGVAGDHLARRAHPLAEQMTVRERGRAISLQRAALAKAFPEATSRLAIFVHGLAGNESCWRFFSQRHYGNRHTTYGSQLRADLGYTPVYVRYNSGLHISENGRQLSALVERLVDGWPVPIDEISLVGHSLGGLVLRSACHDGRERAAGWIAPVRHVFYLGSPHSGAPLEKFGNLATWALGHFSGTRDLAAFINRRSAGIKDLRFGALLDEHWQEADVDELLVDRTGDVPFLDGATHYFIAATVTRDPRHPIGAAIGDWLVREPSASGRARIRRHRSPVAKERHFGGVSHMGLVNHPEVYTQMRRWLEGRADRSRTS